MLRSRFAFRDPALAFARARLEAEALVLTGWRLRGRYRRRIPLDRILQADVPGDGRLLLWLSHGEAVRLRIGDPHAWKAAIEARQGGRGDYWDAGTR